jgi:hypothetical protein
VIVRDVPSSVALFVQVAVLTHRPRRPLLRWLLLVTCGCAVSACRRPDPVLRERVVERDQLRREVAGFQSLDALGPGKVMDRSTDVLISVSDTLLRAIIEESFPLTIRIRNGFVVTLTGATVVFRANVARVDIVGQLRRESFPSVSASMQLRGALDAFVIDTSQALRARISIDDIALTAAKGAPAAFDPLLVNLLQNVVERSLPELTASLPGVAIPVRLDRAMQLPAFGRDSLISVRGARSEIQIRPSRVIAFQDRLWIILRVVLGEFVADAAMASR